MKVTQSLSELQQHLEDHIGFLRSSSESFDAGLDGEAKRLAVSLRVLFHDTPKSHSLLGQLDHLAGKFISTAIPHDTSNIATHGGLIMIAMSQKSAFYVAPLDDIIVERWLPFVDWWNETVFVDDRKEALTRKELVLSVADQDGGAHVDPKLNEVYARLSRHNSLGWIFSGASGHVPVRNAERAAVRQIAHETLKTLISGYRKKPAINAEILVGGSMVHEGETPPLPKPPKIGRNEQCPCGSGKKYKKCHGAPTI